MKLLLLTLLTTCVSAVIRGINTFGFECEYSALMCTWQHDVQWHVSKIKELGFNSLRVPFSYDFIQRNDYTQMDELFKQCSEQGLDLVLDYHRLHNTHQSFAPYDQEITFDSFLWSWKKILDRYQGYPRLTAVDIWNEYQGSSAEEWNNLARQIVNFLEKHFPGRFLYYVGGTNWGGSLHSVNLEDLAFSDRIRYSIHKYYFSDSEKYEDKWDYSFSPFKAVMNVGEFGYMSEKPEQVEWIKRFIAYLRRVGVRDTYFWSYSGNSGDTKGILLDDCTSVDYSKINMLHTLWDDNPVLMRKNRYLRSNATIGPEVIIFASSP